MIYLPFIGSLSVATATIMEKIVLRKKKIEPKIYINALGIAIIIAMIPFLYFFWELNPIAFETKNLLIFLAVVIFSIFGNLLSFYALKWEKINNVEPARMLEPLFVIVLALIFSLLFDSGMYERNFKIVIPALIASSALVFSHIRRHHLEFNKYFIAAILGSLFFAGELILSRLILDYYSPTTFYFLRVLGIFIITIILFHPKFETIDKKTRWEILAIGFIWAIYRVILYYGYIKLGVIFTTLIIMLSPVFTYAFAWKFLNEKLHWKNIVSATIITACVLYAVLA